MKAIWNGSVIAESDDTVIVEGNHYFPEASLHRAHFKPSDSHTTCGWKGEASYWDVVVGDQVNRDAAWYYPDPKPAAQLPDGLRHAADPLELPRRRRLRPAARGASRPAWRRVRLERSAAQGAPNAQAADRLDKLLVKPH
jgi:hypothetical protein